MLEPAIKYEEQLQKKLKESRQKDKIRYSYYDPLYNYTALRGGIKIEANTMRKHQFVSVYKGEVMGYISYNISLPDYRVYHYETISFGNNPIVFAMDYKRAVDNIFRLYKFRKINFCVFEGNPILKVYDAKIEKFGGRIVGIQKEHSKLADGKYHDLKLYEILREDYLRVR